MSVLEIIYFLLKWWLPLWTTLVPTLVHTCVSSLWWEYWTAAVRMKINIDFLLTRGRTRRSSIMSLRALDDLWQFKSLAFPWSPIIRNKPLLVAVDIPKCVFKWCVLPPLPVKRVLPRVPMEYITVRALVVWNNDPLVPGDSTVDCGVMVIQLKNVIWRLS